MNDRTVFHQTESHALSDQRRAQELQVITALTVTGEPAVLLYGKGLRLLLPAEQGVRVSRDITDHLAEAKAIAHTRYTTYSIEQESHAANSTE